MSEAFEEAKLVVIGAGSAWDTYVPQLQAVRAALARVAETSVGAMGSANDVEKLERRLDELGDAIVMDPMSVTALDVDAVEAAVDELGRRAEAAEHFRIEALAHVATARALLDELRDAERAAAEAHREGRDQDRGAAGRGAGRTAAQ